MKHRVIIRADGSAVIGMGHIVRCLALADMLRDDFEIIFAIQEKDKNVADLIRSNSIKIILLPVTTDFNTDAINLSKNIEHGDIVVLDGYNFKTEYQKTIRLSKCKLVCIDDLHAWHHFADVIINHAEGISQSDYSIETYTRLYSGFQYALLRKVFLQPTTQRVIKDIKRIFISMGAADIHNLSGKFTEAILQINGIEEIHLMVGSVNPHLKKLYEQFAESGQAKIYFHINISADELKKLLQNCDVAICPASSISLECCSVGIGLISGFTSDNQYGILSGLKKNNCAMDFGDMTKLSVDEIKNRISEFVKNPDSINEMISNQKKIIDGKSPQRILNIFRKLHSAKLLFRFADESDTELYYKWANDPLVRINSYNQNPVDYKDHVKWFKSKLKSENCFFYLFLNEENRPVGQVRIDKGKDEVVIGISIDEAFRGESLGVDMIKMSCSDYLKKNTQSSIVAYIKEDNIASYNVFKNAGFTGETTVIVQGCKSYKLIHKLDS